MNPFDALKKIVTDLYSDPVAFMVGQGYSQQPKKAEAKKPSPAKPLATKKAPPPPNKVRVNPAANTFQSGMMNQPMQGRYFNISPIDMDTYGGNVNGMNPNNRLQGSAPLMNQPMQNRYFNVNPVDMDAVPGNQRGYYQGGGYRPVKRPRPGNLRVKR